MTNTHHTRPGYTLIEMLLVVTILAVFAALVITNADAGAHDRLTSLAKVIQTDLAYARSLAVANGTPYQVSFDAALGQYTLEHAGDDTDWDTLAPSPFHPQVGSNTSHTVRIEDLPHVGSEVRILGAFIESSAGVLTRVDEVTFGTLGETKDRSEKTVIWLAYGSSLEMRYLSIHINPITGLSNIDELTAQTPKIDHSAYSLSKESGSGPLFGETNLLAAKSLAENFGPDPFLYSQQTFRT